nr:hypothetical protein [Tanacetum cinerariifolium]
SSDSTDWNRAPSEMCSDIWLDVKRHVISLRTTYSEIFPDVGRPVTIDNVIPHAFPTYKIVHQSDVADGVGHQLVERFVSTLVGDQAFGTILKNVSSPKVHL